MPCLIIHEVIMLKKAMPHLINQKHKSYDLYFEFLSPEDRKRIHDDLLQGYSIELPNLGRINDHDVSNNVKNIKKEDIGPYEESYIERMLKVPSKEVILKYNQKNHSYEKIIDKISWDNYYKTIQAQFFEIDPEMLLRLLQDYLKSIKEDWNYILPTEFYELLKSGQNPYFLIDLRRPEDYQRGHIPEAINIFWLDILREDNLKKLPVNREILVYCYVGHTSSQIMVLLNLLGFKVKSLKFGMGISPDEKVKIKGWKDYGYPIKRQSVMISIGSVIKRIAERKTVGINDFVKRQIRSDFAGTKVSLSDLERLRKEAEQGINNGKDKRGYADFVRIITIRDPKILCPIAEITPENKKFLKTEKTKRREGEEEYEHQYFDAKDVKGISSHHINLILYTREQLEKEKEKHTGADYDLISVNAEISEKGAPITPETMRRNIKGPEYGGSGYQHTQKEISQSEKFWNDHALIK